MAGFSGLTAGREASGTQRPWPRFEVDAATWEALGVALDAGEVCLLALWGDSASVHAAIRDEDKRDIAVLTLACPDGVFASLGRHHPPALRSERAIQDLFGFTAAGLPDARPWLDHDRWTVGSPLGTAQAKPPMPRPYAFLAAQGEGLHQIPVGPVHAGVIEPGHFRFNASGEAVVRLEERLGYTHKGVEKLMAGAALDKAAQLAGRVSGDSTVAYALAFAQSVEAALGVEPPVRAVWLRALMAELERLANHFGDIGAICNDAAFALMLAHCGVLRERVLRAAMTCFGHRLMMDRVVPGGVAADLSPEGRACLRTLLDDVRKAFPPLIRLYDDTTSLQDRTVGTGIVSKALARQFAVGGYVGRASGRNFDVRRDHSYAPYGDLRFEVPVFGEGDVNARVWVRIREVEQSLSLVEQILGSLPEGDIRVAVEGGSGEGLGLVEGFRGDILAWTAIEDGLVRRCHLRDPSWFQWPLLEAAIEGNIVADFPLCNKSFNCSYSGHDL
ncbi:Hydrogenase-4 component G [Labrys miyagiensis]